MRTQDNQFNTQTDTLKKQLSKLSKNDLKKIVHVLFLTFLLSSAIAIFYVWQMQLKIRDMDHMGRQFHTHIVQTHTTFEQFVFALFSATLWQGKDVESMRGFEKAYIQYVDSLERLQLFSSKHLPNQFIEEMQEIKRLSKNLIVIARLMPEDFAQSYFNGIESLRVIESFNDNLEENLATLEKALEDKLRVKTDNILKTIEYWNAVLIVFLMLMGMVFFFFFKQSIKNEKLIKAFNTSMEQAINDIREKDQVLIQQGRFTAIGKMLSMIAHQWRQPLNAISTASINLKLFSEMGNLDNEQLAKQCKFIEQQTQKMSGTIENFIHFFQFDTEKKVFNLGKTLHDVEELMNIQLQNNGIIWEIEQEGDVALYGVKNQFQHVLLSLLSNAKESLEEGKSEQKRIYTRVRKQDENIEIVIGDTGAGISEEILPLIFDPYFTTKHSAVGTGMGLYMSKIIIEQHFGGRIEAKNTAEGAEFVLKIPLVEKVSIS